MVALDYPAITTPAKNLTSPTTSGGSGTSRVETSGTAATTPTVPTANSATTAPSTNNNSLRKNSNKADNNNNKNNNDDINYTGMDSSVEDIEDDEDCCSTSTNSHKANIDNCKMKSVYNKIHNNNNNINNNNIVSNKSKSTNPTSKDPEAVKRGLSLNLNMSGKELEDFTLKSPKSPMLNHRLQPPYSHRGSVDLEDRKSLREALYQGIFLRHRKTIFAMGSFLKMLRNRNSHYNSMRCSSDDIDKVR